MTTKKRREVPDKAALERHKQGTLDLAIQREDAIRQRR